MPHPRLLSLSTTYTISMLAWFALRLLWFDTLWWLALLNSVALFLFLPLPLLLAAALVRRAWRAASTLLVPLALCGWLFGAALLPPLPRAESDAPTLRAMTFNVLYRNRDSAAIVASIRAAQPDLIGFQELTERQMAALRETLGAEYPYAALHAPGGEAGVGLLSRVPLADAAPFALPPRNLALRARLTIHGMPLDVLVAHLAPNRVLSSAPRDLPAAATAFYATKAQEAASLVQAAQGTHAPLLLLCDCNLSDTSQAYTMLATALRDSFRETGRGLGYTYPAGVLPLQRYDYIWHSPELHALEARTGAAGGSDHLPVLVRLRLPDGKAASPRGVIQHQRSQQREVIGRERL